MQLEKLTELIELNEQEYHGFAQTHPYASFLNSIFAGRKMKQNGWKIQYLGLKDDQTIQAAVMLASRSIHVGTYYYAPRGFLIDYENQQMLDHFVTLLKRYLKKHQGVYLKIDPCVIYQKHDPDGVPYENYPKNDRFLHQMRNLGFEHQGLFTGYNPNSQCRWVSILDLQGKTEETLFSEFSYQTRQDIRNAEKHDVHVRTLQYDELHILEKMEQQSAQRQNFQAMPLTYYQELLNAYGEHCKILFAYLDLPEFETLLKEKIQKNAEEIENLTLQLSQKASEKKQKRLKEAQTVEQSLAKKLNELAEMKQTHEKELPLSAACFIKYGHEIVYLESGSSYEYRKYKGAYAIQWEIIKEALREQYPYYNFYGISGLFEKDQQGYGVFDFKRGFHAEVIEYTGDFILCLSKPKMMLYHLLKKLRP